MTPLSFTELLKKVDFPPLLKVPVKELVGVPFADWPDAAHEPWYWMGYNRKAQTSGGQYHRPRALIQVNNRMISPVRPLWDYVTGVPLEDKQKIAYIHRGARDDSKDDINPAHYILLQKRDKPKRRNNKRAKPIQEIAALMEMANFWPTTIEQLLDRWPDFKDYSKEELNATIAAVTL